MQGVGAKPGAVAAAVIAACLCTSTAEARRVVYLNAQPTMLTDAHEQDPTMNSYASGGFTPGPISGWPALTDADKDLLKFLMKEATVPFDITFTWERPASGSYDMLVMGTEADSAALFPESSCSAALGLADCEDGHGENISFLFYGCMSQDHQADLRRVAHTALKGLGFGWGLENVSVGGEVMGTYSGNALRFGNECVSVVGTSLCFHQGCPAGQQNSEADLLAVIGPRVDDGPPIVEITTPAHLSVVGSDFTVEAAVEDLFGGLEVTLEIVEVEQRLTDAEPPYRWNLSSVPDGTWTLRVDVVDADGNEAVDEVVVCIGTDECDPGSPGPGGGTESGSGGSEGDTDEGPGNGGDGGGIDPTLPSGGGTADATGPAGGACHCRAQGDDGRRGALVLLALVGICSRSRRRRVTRAG